MLCKLLRAAAENIVITKNHIMSTTMTVQHIFYYEFPFTNYAVCLCARERLVPATRSVPCGVAAALK